MKTVCLTPSANWYSAGALASDGDRLLVGCARQALLLAGPAPASDPPGTTAPSLQCHGVIEDAHRDRVTGAVVWRVTPDTVSVVSCGEDGVVKLWKCDFTEEGNKFQSRCERQHNAHGVSLRCSYDDDGNDGLYSVRFTSGFIVSMITQFKLFVCCV